MSVRAEINHFLAGGSLVLLLIVLGLGVWASGSEIAAAVIAPGRVVVASASRQVQHPTGGKVREVSVSNGDRVAAGDVLLRLDESSSRAQLALVERQRAELDVLEARLLAERDGHDEFVAPNRSSPSLDLTDTVRRETHLLQSRRAVLESEKSELRKRIGQLREDGEGLARQIAAKEREIEYLREEIDVRRRLDSEREALEGAIRQVREREVQKVSQLLSLRRELARLEGELARLKSLAGQTSSRVAEVELMILRLDQEHRRAVLMELRDVQARAHDLDARQGSLEEQLRQLEVRAEVAGRVHELKVSGAGAVIGPGEVVMLIVPEADRLAIEVKVEPGDIDRVLASRRALVRFLALDQKTTPELAGKVMSVSADLSHDMRTGAAFFVVRVELSEAELHKLGGTPLVPGMPAEVQIETNRRTALSYLLKPLSDHLARAWKER